MQHVGPYVLKYSYSGCVMPGCIHPFVFLEICNHDITKHYSNSTQCEHTPLPHHMEIGSVIT